MKKFIFAFVIAISLLKTAPVLAGPDDVDYFNQFLFRKDSTGNDPDFPTYSYRYLMSRYNAMYKRADGIYVNPWISLMLLEDGKFWMEYRENYFKSPDDTQFTPGPCKIIEGRWAVPATQLEVSDLIIGDRALVEGSNAVDIRFQKDIVSVGLTSAKIDMTLGVSNSDPRLSPFCW